MSFDAKLDAYAEVAVAVGIDLQPGQRLIVDAKLEAAPLVRRIAAHAYRRGARLVDVIWNDPEVTLTRYRHAPDGSFDQSAAWRSEAYRSAGEGGDAVLQVRAPEPTLFADVDPKRIGAWGSSAGGHLAALLGTSGGVADLEGDLGHLDHSSRVQAVVDFCGPADFVAWKVKRSPEMALFGGTIEEKKKLARAASPAAHASPDDPPFFIVHGKKDRTVPVRQAELLDAALRKAKANSTLLILDELGHGLMNPDTQGLALLFFEMHLLRK